MEERSALDALDLLIDWGVTIAVFVVGPYKMAQLLEIRSLVGVYAFVALGYFAGRYAHGAILYYAYISGEEGALLMMMTAPMVEFMIKVICGTGFIMLWKIVESVAR